MEKIKSLNKAIKENQLAYGKVEVKLPTDSEFAKEFGGEIDTFRPNIDWGASYGSPIKEVTKEEINKIYPAIKRAPYDSSIDTLIRKIVKEEVRKILGAI